MAQKIEFGQKFILNQYVQSIGNAGKVITFGADYKDKKMLQYFLRTGEISRLADNYPLSAGEDTVEVSAVDSVIASETKQSTESTGIATPAARNSSKTKSAN